MNPRGWLALGGIVLAVALLLLFRPVHLGVDASRAQEMTESLLLERGVHLQRDLEGESIRVLTSGRFQWRLVERRYRVADDFAWDSFRSSLEKKLQRRRLVLFKSDRRRQAGGGWTFQGEIRAAQALEAGPLYRFLLIPRAAAARPAAPAWTFPTGSGKIAIVLDDWGYNLRHVPVLSSLPHPVTIAVLPNLPHSAQVAKEARSHGHEVILHMPMEAVSPGAPREEGTILTTTPEQEVRRLFDQALKSVPGARGVSNHQGSKATADRAVMGAVLRELKRRRLFFLDSFVTEQSVCREVAERTGVAFVQRSVFLDNQESEEAIRQRLLELASAARDQGEAVGIGHDHPAMIAALEKAVPALEKAGYTLVRLSELAETPSRR